MRTLRDSTGLFKKNVWTKCARTFSHTKRRSKTISSTTTGNGCTWASILFLRFKKSSKVFQAIDQRTVPLFLKLTPVWVELQLVVAPENSALVSQSLVQPFLYP